MEILERIPVALDPGVVGRRLRFKPGRGGTGGVEAFLRRARSLIDLRAAYEILYVGEKGEGSVAVGGVVFESRVLRRNIDGVHKVFPYVMTVGPELERAASSCGDLLEQYYLEELANLVLEDGVTWLAERLGNRWRFPRLSSMSPGSLEDWPITEQGKLFSLLGDVEKRLGVRLTENLLMVPRKSVSGILFPSDEDFNACRLCPREPCPSRRAPYDSALADSRK